MADSKKNNRYRNPANDLIDAAVGRTNKAARAVGNTTKKSVKATSAAASRTIKKESEAKSKDRSQLAKRKAELERRRKEAEKAKPKPTAKPAAKSQLSSQGVRDYAGRGAKTYTVPTGSKEYNDARNRQIATNRALLKTVGNPENNPSPAPAASRPSTPAPARRSGSTSSTPKPAPKPAGKVPSGERRVSAATANRESGNYGTSRSNNPLMKGMTDRMRQREERDGVGPVKDGNRYAADMKNTTQGVGPVASGERYASGVKNGMPKNEQVKAKAPAPRTASKPRQRPGTGRDDMLSRYMEERKRRQSGQSRMIG